MVPDFQDGTALDMDPPHFGVFSNARQRCFLHALWDTVGEQSSGLLLAGFGLS